MGSFASSLRCITVVGGGKREIESKVAAADDSLKESPDSTSSFRSKVVSWLITRQNSSSPRTATAAAAEQQLLSVTPMRRSASSNLLSPSSASKAGSLPGGGKALLQPGHSLMDWVRLCKQGADLAGTQGQVLSVSESDMNEHCAADNAWVVLKGKVYNVSAYMAYHPGGTQELMRGVGTDATRLFNEVHRWVNFESLLKECFVGYFTGSTGKLPPVRQIRSGSQQLSSEEHLSPVAATSASSSASPSSIRSLIAKASGIEHNWRQRGDIVELEIDLGHNWLVPISDCDIFLNWLDDFTECHIKITACLKNFDFDCIEVRWKPAHELNLGSNFSGQLLNSNKLIVRAKKNAPNVHWDRLGEIKILAIDEKSMPSFQKCRVASIDRATRDVNLYTLDLPFGSLCHIPTAHHLYVKLDIADDVSVTHAYTPVELLADLFLSDAARAAKAKMTLLRKRLHLLIKIYPNGLLTSTLATFEPGWSLLVSDSTDGHFKMSSIPYNCRTIILLAAGSGLTPMLGIIDRVVVAAGKQQLAAGAGACVILMYFNQKVTDIIWREELDMLATNFRQRFQVIYVLDEPDDSWKGAQGRICSELLKKYLPLISSSTELALLWFAVCGPRSFNELAVFVLQMLGVTEQQIHVFQ